jgi:hypothetical protein
MYLLTVLAVRFAAKAAAQGAPANAPQKNPKLSTALVVLSQSVTQSAAPPVPGVKVGPPSGFSVNNLRIDPGCAAHWAHPHRGECRGAKLHRTRFKKLRYRRLSLWCKLPSLQRTKKTRPVHSYFFPLDSSDRSFPNCSGSWLFVQ